MLLILITCIVWLGALFLKVNVENNHPDCSTFCYRNKCYKYYLHFYQS